MNNEDLSAILRDLTMLATQAADLLRGTISESDYRDQCTLLYLRIEAAFPASDPKPKSA